MIASILRGGLGNQMFIYAMVKAMALRNNTTYSFNLRYGFKNDFKYKRNLELTCLNVNLKENRKATFDYSLGRLCMIISKKTGRNFLIPSYKYIVESEPLHFQKELVERNWRNVFLEGYWQSEKYFQDYTNQIKKDFEITIPIEDEVKRELQIIEGKGANTVLIGIRRYQECSELADGLVLNEDYYNKAIKIMESKLSDPVFIVFTQQQEWARNHICSKSPIYFVKPKYGDFNSIKDMFLMTHCRHAIISNSSFYWWGAWLSKAGDGIVIAPDNFLNKDSVCKRWLIL